MRENDVLELLDGFTEQPLVVRAGEGDEEIPRPFSRFPSKRFAACLQNEPVAALSTRPCRTVDIIEQSLWHVECRRWHMENIFYSIRNVNTKISPMARLATYFVAAQSPISPMPALSQPLIVGHGGTEHEGHRDHQQPSR
jgi:hypothetical protein